MIRFCHPLWREVGCARRRSSALCALALTAAFLPAVLSAQVTEDAPHTSDLRKLTLEQLMEIEVTSVSRRSEKLSEAPAAIRIVTDDEIRRSGAVVLPQALRLAPSLQVAQVSASYWTVGARGLNQTGSTSNKLLVMIDGRSVYRPLISGTYWDSVDVFLPDIDTIEVVNGPGGATWGSNAVNGVIHVLTKHSEDTQGSLLYGGAGGEERGYGGFRHGGRLGENATFRVYAKHTERDAAVRSNGADAGNDYRFTQAGFRGDLRAGGDTEFTLSGDYYRGRIDIANARPGRFEGGNLVARWTREPSPDSRLTLKAFYDVAYRGAPTTFADQMDTVDLDLQHELALPGRAHHLVWGLNVRESRDHVRNLPTQQFIPAQFTHRLVSGFIQDEIRFLEDRARLTLGAKYEYNNYSGSDYQPNVRVAWVPSARTTVWAAVSRAVRTPARVDRDLYVGAHPPYLAAGGPNFRSERLLAYELGWRASVVAHTSASLSLFLHDYNGLRTLEQPLPYTFENGLDARTYGLEASFRHEPRPWLSWSVGYVLLKKDFTLEPWSRDLNAGLVEQADPEHQLHVRGSVDLPGNWEFDAGYRYIAEVPTLASRTISFLPSYHQVDARLGWVSRRGYELSLVGTNLLDPSHPEAGAINSRLEIERSVHVQVTWRF